MNQMENDECYDPVAAYRMDIIEPHKFKQGSLTMLRKVSE